MVEHIHLSSGSGDGSGGIECSVDEGGFGTILGIGIGLGSSVILNIGQNMQALGQQMTERPLASGSCKSGKSVWAIGLALFISGSIGNMVAMAFASASILVPLESSQFVTNIFFSKLILKKSITLRQWLGTTMAVAGTVLTCYFGPNDERCFTMEQMQSFYLNAAWIVYLVASFSAAGVGWLFYFRLRKIPEQHRSPTTDDVTLPALFAVSSALLGGAQMIVHSKALAELFDMMIGGVISFGGLFSSWFFWLELIITAACGIFWAVQMNNSLGLYDPLFIIPLLQSSYITLGATASGIFFREFETLHIDGNAGAMSWFFFIGGMLMIVVGILLLAPVKEKRGRKSSWFTSTSAPITRQMQLDAQGSCVEVHLSSAFTAPPRCSKASSFGRSSRSEEGGAVVDPGEIELGELRGGDDDDDDLTPGRSHRRSLSGRLSAAALEKVKEGFSPSSMSPSSLNLSWNQKKERMRLVDDESVHGAGNGNGAPAPSAISVDEDEAAPSVTSPALSSGGSRSSRRASRERAEPEEVIDVVSEPL